MKIQLMYTALPCIQELLKKGAPRGFRSMGIKYIAISCRLDNIEYKYAIKDYAKIYYNKTNANDFQYNEIQNWFKWAYRLNKNQIFWSCKTSTLTKYCNSDVCPIKNNII